MELSPGNRGGDFTVVDTSRYKCLLSAYQRVFTLRGSLQQIIDMNSCLLADAREIARTALEDDMNRWENPDPDDQDRNDWIEDRQGCNPETLEEPAECLACGLWCEADALHRYSLDAYAEPDDYDLFCPRCESDDIRLHRPKEDR